MGKEKWSPEEKEKRLLELHEELFRFLEEKRKANPDLRFTLRRTNRRQMLRKGYWFHGNEEEVWFSFWDGFDWRERKPVICFVIDLEGRLRLEYKPSNTLRNSDINKELKAIYEECAYANDRFPDPGQWLKSLKVYLKEGVNQNDYSRLNNAIERLGTYKYVSIRIKAREIPNKLRAPDFEWAFGNVLKFRNELTQLKRGAGVIQVPISLKTFSAEHYKGIKHLFLSLPDNPSNWIFISGHNGAGKTTLLQGIAWALNGISDSNFVPFETPDSLISHLFFSNDALNKVYAIRNKDILSVKEEYPDLESGDAYRNRLDLDSSRSLNRDGTSYRSVDPLHNPRSFDPDMTQGTTRDGAIRRSIDEGIISRRTLTPEDTHRGFVEVNISDSSEYFNFLVAFGAARDYSKPLDRNTPKYRIKSLFVNETEFLDIEENLSRWYYKQDYQQFKEKFYAIKEILLDLMAPYMEDIFLIEPKDTIYYQERAENGELYGPVEFDQLASGFQSIIRLIGDMILKLMATQPEVTDPSELKGIVIIDELDVHFHPRLQRLLPGKLTDIFPDIQFITSTHSPLPILGAPKGSTFIKVERSPEKGITARILDIDVTKLQPNAILTSAFFDLEGEELESVVKHPPEEVILEDDYQEYLNRKNRDQALREWEQSDEEFPDHLFQ